MAGKLSLLCVAVALAGFVAGGKVSPSLTNSLAVNPFQRVNVFVNLKDGDTQATLNQVFLLNTRATRAQRSQAVYDSLNAFAARSQANVLRFLNSAVMTQSSVEIKSFWITNQVYVKGADRRLIESLAALDDVASIEEDQLIQLVDPVPIGEPSFGSHDVGLFAEWGVDKILTEQAWAVLKTNGTGAVVGIIDTGARGTHQDIRASFRGGTHSWYNAISITPAPVDGNGHGTHVTGTVLGANGLGVAPGAKWISCKGLADNGGGSVAQLVACGEFMACPHDANGNNRDCTQSPDIVSNSWGGSGGQDFYDPVIRAWHAAGIIPIFANGNYGPFDPPKACRYTASPADSAAGVIAVGATGSNDGIADFSYRGPSRSGEQTPHVSAPGVDVRSAWYTGDNAYNTISGTSMATPHVAGLVALLRSHSPHISYDQVKNILQDTADRNLPSTGETCVGVSDNVFPNYQYGYGRVNALRAANALLNSF